MVKIWLLNEDGSDHHQPCQRDPIQFIDVGELKKRTGILYWKLDADNYESDLAKICKDRGYNYFDFLELYPEATVDYEEKLRQFFQEHLHADEEIRFFLDGGGYFDVRDVNDNWIRIEVTKGDLIILPPGIYHRFTIGPQNYVRIKRIFTEEPVWVAFNRPADDHPARTTYLQLATKNFA